MAPKRDFQASISKVLFFKFSMTGRQADKQNMFFPSFRKEERDVGHEISIRECFKDLYEAIIVVEQFLPSILERNLYSDPGFLQFLKKYEQKEIYSLLGKK